MAPAQRSDVRSSLTAIILCGGRGKRLRPLTDETPKPLLPVGGRPVVSHIMENFARHGVTDFALCIGYKSDAFREYFGESDDYRRMDDQGATAPRFRRTDDGWTVRLCDSGRDTNKSGRLLHAREFLDADRFVMTYGDGLADVDVTDLLDRHVGEGRTATVTAYRPPVSFGVLETRNTRVEAIEEKPLADSLVNIGFLAFEEDLFDYLRSDAGLERDALDELADDGELSFYEHDGFFIGIDTMKELDDARSLANDLDDPPWLRNPGTVRQSG